MKEFISELYKNDKALITFLFVFMILQPFLDVRAFFENASLEILGMAIPTFIRCLGIFILFLLSLRHIKKDKEHIFYCFYFLVFGIYMIIHHIIGSGPIEMPASYAYSIVTELFYFIRMVLPFVIMYAVKHANISYQTFINVILISSSIIGGVIVISNILHISTPSYAIGGTQNLYNIFEWFTVGIDADAFETYTSKGWFFMANQISGLMVLLLPLNIYDFIMKPKTLNTVSSLLLSISMLMLGTRVSAYGMIGIIAVMLVVALFFFFLHKKIEKKNLLLYLVFTILIGGLFLNSPIHNRIYTYGEVEDLEVDADIDEIVFSDDWKEMYVLENYDERKIQKVYIYQLYPFQFDVDFWYDFIKENTGEVIQNRELQTKITTRIASMNTSVVYDLFGYSFSRFRSGHMYIENDFVVHYYTIGIFGILLLLCPWIIVLLKGALHIVKEKFKYFDFKICSLLFSICICLGAALMSGHVLDELIVTLYIGFIAGYTLHHMKGEK